MVYRPAGLPARNLAASSAPRTNPSRLSAPVARAPGSRPASRKRRYARPDNRRSGGRGSRSRAGRCRFSCAGRPAISRPANAPLAGELGQAQGRAAGRVFLGLVMPFDDGDVGGSPSERAASPTSFMSRLTARLMLGAIRIGISVAARSRSRRSAGLRPVVPTTRGIFRVRQHSVIAGTAGGSEKSIMTSTADAGRQRSGKARPPPGAGPPRRRRRGRDRDGRPAPGPRASFEHGVLGDELDQARAHAARCAMNSDRRESLETRSCVPLFKMRAATRFPE